MGFEFIVPLTRDDLLNRTSFNQYVVDEVYTLRQLPGKIQEYRNVYRGKGPRAILESFDSLFSALMNFRDADMTLKEEVYDIILKGIANITNELPHFLDDILEAEIRLDNLNMVKMHCYLMCQFMEAFENENSKPSVTTGRGRGKGQKRPDNMRWDFDCERGVHALLKMVQLNIYRLWDPPVVEEEFVNMLTTCCYKLLENPSINRNKTVRDSIFQIIGIMVKRYNHALSATLKIIQLLQHFEHLVSPLAQAVELMVVEFGAPNIVGEIMREIGRMDPRDLARDSSGTHAYSQFMVEVAERVPAVMLPNMSVIVTLLDEEPYTIRNGVLGVMGEILIQILSKDNLDNKLKATRDSFLDKLEEHMHDVNAFVRSKTLQIWLNIVNKKALPLTRQSDIVELVIGRLQDKSSQVRKYAMQVVVALMKSNPFAAKLSIEELTASYESERAKLMTMIPEGGLKPIVDPTTQALADWAQLEEGVLTTCIDVLEEERSPQDYLIEEEETSQSVMKKITQLLTDRELKDAVILLTAAKEAFTEDPILKDQEASQEDPEETEVIPPVRKLADTVKAVFIASTVEKLSAAASQDPSQSNLQHEISKQQVLVQYLKDCVLFISQIQKAVETICQLLGSKTTTDILESIEFFVTSFEFGVTNAMIGVRRMLALVWSKEGGIKDAVVNAYRRLYLSPSEGNQRTKALAIVKNLSALIHGASKGELTSMEELVQEFVKSKDIDQSVIKVMWERFAMKITATTSVESRAALVLLGMAAGAEEGIAQSNIKVLVQEGLGVRAEENLQLAKDACNVLIKLGGTAKPKAGALVEPYRLEQDHDIFTHLQDLILKGFKRGDDPHWIPFTEQAINVIYKLAEHPDVIVTSILKALVASIAEQTTTVVGEPERNVEEEKPEASVEGEKPSQGEEEESDKPEGTQAEKPEESEPGSSQGSQNTQRPSQVEINCPTNSLTMLVSLAGHVALRQLIHLDVAVFGELKRRHQVQEEQETKKKKVSHTPKTKESTSETMEEEMGLAGAAAEDAEAEYIRKICETDIVNGENFLAILRPVLVTICNNPKKYQDANLQTAASLALAKFMLVSSEFCEDHLQLLFTILEKSPNPVIRGNTIIALGDLTFRFPNLIEPWTPNLYARLRDDSPQVRRNTLMVLTHLILNDMVKVKGQISEMATCIMDEDTRISSLAKLFFLELAKKGNAVYNVMPDMVSRLSDLDVGVSEESFRTIMKYLFVYIQKDRQCESLVEKLCHRFRATRSERQWRDIAFCLSLLTYSERGIRKLTENFACYGDKLADKDVHNSFAIVIAGAKKFAKPDIKALVDELEARILECHCKGLNDEEVADKAKKASAAAKAFRQARSPRGRRGRGPASGKKVAQVQNRESEDELQPSRPRRGGRTKPRPKLTFSSSEDSDLELFDVDSSQKDSESQKTGSDNENHKPDDECNVESLTPKPMKSAKTSVSSRTTRATSGRKKKGVRT